MIGKCPSCPSKDQVIETQKGHIAFLESQVRELQAKLLELTSPGANARIAFRPPTERPAKEPGPRATHSPTRLAQTRRVDMPLRDPGTRPPAPIQTSADVEASFKQ